jgi:deoxyribose-phosphate aldolase
MEISQYIDHTLLKADASADQIKTLCNEAIQNNFKTVCINSHYIPFAQKLLKDSPVSICTVVGFPLGASPKEVKALEATMAIANGASEIDMVINISALKDELYSIVESDIRLLVETCHSKRVSLKVIIETCLLTEDEKIKACELVVNAGADYVKTSTGFSTGGATEEDIRLMRKTVGPDIGVKASGGIRDRKTADLMIKAGATRLGTSSGIIIVNG